MATRSFRHRLLICVLLAVADFACTHAPRDIAPKTESPSLTTITPAAKERNPLTRVELTALLDLVKNPDLDMRLRIEACWQLGKLGEDAAPITGDLLALTTNDVLRPHLLTALRSLGPGAADVLATAIRTDNLPIRSAAATLLWDMGPRAGKAIPVLTELALNGNPETRRVAVDLLDGLAPYAATAEDALNSLQRDDDPYVAARAQSAVDRIHAAANKTLLPAPVSAGEYRRRIASLYATPAPTPHPADAEAARPNLAAVAETVLASEVNRLAKLLLQGSPREQHDAFAVLKQYAANRPDARAALADAVVNGTLGIQRDAAYELAMLSVEGKKVIPVLEAALEHEDGDTQMLTAFALANVDPYNPRLVPIAMKVLTGSNERVKFEAIHVLSNAKTRPAEADSIVSKYLLDRDFRTRNMAVKIIEADGPPISPTAMSIVESIASSPDNASNAARNLQRLGDDVKPVMPRLLSMTRDNKSAIRSAALFVLSQIAPLDPRFEEAVELAMADDGGADASAMNQYRTAFIRAAMTLPHPSRKVLGPIIVLCGVVDAGVAKTAMIAVRNFGPLVIEEIERPDAGYDSATVMRIASTLAPTLPAAVGPIKKGLADPDPDVRILAVKAFGTLGETARPYVAELKPLFSDSSDKVRFALFDALANLGPVAADLRGPVAARIDEREDALRDRATLTLARISPADPKLVQSLLSLIDRSAGSIHAEAIDALLSIKTNDPDYVPAVMKFLDDSDNELRLRAVNALARQGNSAHAAAAKLSRMVDNQHADVRDGAARALLQVDPDAPALSAAYLAAVRHHDSQVRSLLTPAIRKVNAEASQKLVPKLNVLAQNDPDVAVRSDARSALHAIQKD